MELILQLKEELTLMGLIVLIITAIVKGFFLNQIKKFWVHLKKRKEVYNITIGAVLMFFLFYSIITIKKQVNVVQSKFHKYEKLKGELATGHVFYDYESLINSIEQTAINNFLLLQEYNTQINFPSQKKWKADTHLTNVFGIIFVNRKQNKVYFEYKSVVGKNKMSNEVYYTADYIKDNPKLFKNYLILHGNDRAAFTNGSIKDCTNKPLKRDITKMEKDFKNGIYEYNVCDLRQSFFYVSGRVHGNEQKTFNEINHIYYIIVPFKKESDSYLYFFYSFNSNNASFLSYKVHAMLESFREKIDNYKETIKNYENDNKTD